MTELEELEVEKDPLDSVSADFKDSLLPKGVFSNSQYSLYHICPTQYEFKYVKGLSSGNRPSMGRGSAIHKGVEIALKAKLHNRVIPDIAELNEVITKEFDERTQDIVNWDEEDPIQIKTEAVAAYRLFHTYALPKLNPVAIEKGFAVKVGTVPMVGYIDMIDSVPSMGTEGLSDEEKSLVPRMNVVVDLKTTKTAWSEDKVKKNTQLTLYSHVEGEPNVRIDQLVLLKKAPVFKQVTAVKTPQEVAVYVEHLEETVDLVKRGIFPKTTLDSWACNERHCPFWTQCRGKKR